MYDYSEKALKVFYSICNDWGLDEKERADLLGESDDQLDRISYTFNIYKSLHTIFENSQQADDWIKKPNREFDGQTALQVMIEDPRKVSRYLDAQL